MVVNVLSFAWSGVGDPNGTIIHNTEYLSQFLGEFHTILKYSYGKINANGAQHQAPSMRKKLHVLLCDRP